jgi:hypothetical protein
LRHELHSGAAVLLCGMDEERVAQPDVTPVPGGQKQHEQHALSRGGIHDRLAVHADSGGLDVPAVVAGRLWNREPNREGAQPVAGHPSTTARELVVRDVQASSVGSVTERRISTAINPDHRSCPRSGIVFLAPGCFPKPQPALVSEGSSKRPRQPDGTLGNEAVDVCLAQHSVGGTSSPRPLANTFLPRTAMRSGSPHVPTVCIMRTR